MNDITPKTYLQPGQTFGLLTVLQLDRIDAKRHRYYLCQCECGSPPKSIRADHLTSGRITSCGCVMEARQKELKPPPGAHVDGTYIPSVERILNRKTRADNTTGYPGVSKHVDRHGVVRYHAMLTFQGKVNSLGYFKTVTEAVAAREEAITKFVEPWYDEYTNNVSG